MQLYEKCIDECTCLSVCDMIFNGILEDALLIRQKIKFNRTYSYSLYGNLLNQTILNNVGNLWVLIVFACEMYMWNEFYILFFLHCLIRFFLEKSCNAWQTRLSIIHQNYLVFLALLHFAIKTKILFELWSENIDIDIYYAHRLLCI